MPTRLNRVIVSVTDLDASLGFYRDLLGLTVITRHGELAVLRLDPDLDLNLHQRPATPSDTAVAASFVIDDLDGVCHQWSASGGSIIDAPEERPWGERMAVVRDPDGHIVCLVQNG